MSKLRLLFLLAILAGSVLFIHPARAQGSCSYSIIEDETGTLDTEAICTATRQWSEKGVQLYILFSQGNFNSEGSWFEYLDQMETDMGAREGASLPIYFLAFEATSDGNWTSITFGDVFLNTPFDRETGLLKGVLRNGIKAGNPTQAFVDTLNEGFDVAFPTPPTPVPAAPSGAQVSPPTPIVIVVSPSAPKEPVDLKPVGEGIKTVFLWLLIVGGGFVFVIFGLVPGWKATAVLRKKNEHLATIRVRTTKLLNNLSRLFAGDSAEDMLLFQLLRAYGIESYPKANEEINEWLRRSKIALDEAFMLWKVLEGEKGKKEKLDQRIKAWETLYLTLVGKNPDILNLSDEQIGRLLDPSADVDVDSVDVQLVEQVRAIAKELAGGGYKINFLLVDPATADKQGILGYLKLVKDQLAELRQSKAKAGPMIQKARDKRAEMADGPFPGNLNAQQVFTKPDALLAEAEADFQNQLWLTVVRKAEDVVGQLSLIKQLLPTILDAQERLQTVKSEFKANDVLPSVETLFGFPEAIMASSLRGVIEGDYGQAEEFAADLLEALDSLATLSEGMVAAHTAHLQRISKVDRISNKGFRLQFYSQMVAEVESDIAEIGQSLIEGDYNQADAMLREMTRDSEALLGQAEALERLHDQNLAEIKRFSVETARVAAFNTAHASPAWQTLNGYPRGNRNGIIGIEAPANILTELFDDPADQDDLASRIANLNSMKEQQFKEAQEELVAAFAQLREAETQLQAIIDRLEDVQDAERQASPALAQVRTEMQNSIAKRNQFDRYVDQEVDRQIEEAGNIVQKVQGLIDAQEFLAAMNLLLKARTMLTQAMAEVDEQSTEILALLEKLEAARTEAVQVVAEITVDFGKLILVLQSESANRAIQDATQSLRKAQSASEKLAGLEDHDLKQAAQTALQLFEQVLDGAEVAIRQMSQDRSAYEQLFSSAEQAIDDAEEAIDAARQTTDDSDAGTAGESALRRAEQLLPDLPSYGMSVSQLRQIQRLAEQALEAAEDAESEAQAHINAVEAERERKRKEEAARLEREAAERRRRESYSSSSSSYGGSWPSSSGGGSSRPPSYGGSSRPSSTGGSTRSPSIGGSHRSPSMGGSTRR